MAVLSRSPAALLASQALATAPPVQSKQQARAELTWRHRRDADAADRPSSRRPLKTAQDLENSSESFAAAPGARGFAKAIHVCRSAKHNRMKRVGSGLCWRDQACRLWSLFRGSGDDSCPAGGPGGRGSIRSGHSFLARRDGPGAGQGACGRALMRSQTVTAAAAGASWPGSAGGDVGGRVLAGCASFVDRDTASCGARRRPRAQGEGQPFALVQRRWPSRRRAPSGLIHPTWLKTVPQEPTMRVSNRALR